MTETVLDPIALDPFARDADPSADSGGRALLGADGAGVGDPRRRRRRTDLVVIHCAATKPSQDIGRREIDAWHRARGFRGVGYHLIVRRSGGVEIGRPLGERGAHAAGFNATSVGVCLVGGVAEDGRTPEPNFTPAQYAALRRLVRELGGLYPQARVCGHRDLPGVAKACPCFDVGLWLALREAGPRKP